MRHKYPYIILLFIVLISVYLVLFSNKANVPQNNPPQVSPTPSNVSSYTASFLIFINGIRQPFNSPTYFSLSPDIYIEGKNPAIIHVKKGNVVWSDFFSTLPMGISETCLTLSSRTFCNEDDDLVTSTSGKLVFILNGKENPKALNTPINPGDKLLITYGNLTSQQLQSQYNLIPEMVTSESAQLELEE